MPCSCRILSLAAGGCVDMTSYSTPFPMQHERTPKTDQRIPNYGHCSASTRGECMHMSELEVTILDLQRAPYRREACCRVCTGHKDYHKFHLRWSLRSKPSRSTSSRSTDITLPAAQLDVHAHTAPHRHLATNEHKGRTISSRTPSLDRSYLLREGSISICQQSQGHCRKVGDR